MSHLKWADEIDKQDQGTHTDWASEIDKELQPQQEGWGSWLLRNVNEKVALPLGAASAGAVEGIEHGVASIGNLGLQLAGSDKRIPYLDQRYLVAGQPGLDAMFLGGKIAGSLLPGIGAAGKATQGIQALDKAKRLSPLAVDAISGGLSGFATGAQSEYDTMGRFIGGGLGATVPTVFNLTRPAITSRILKKEAELGKEMADSYDKVFSTIDKRGLADKHLFTPRQRATIQRQMPKEAKDTLKDFINNPTFKQAHDTQSDLWKIQEKLTDKFDKLARDKVPPTSSLIKDYHEINALRDRIKDGMQTFMERNKAQDIGQAYKDVGKRYAKEYGMYLEKPVKRFKAAEKGFGTKKFMNELKDIINKEGKGHYYEDIKGFSARNKIDPALAYAKLFGAGAAGMGLAHQFLPYKAREALEGVIDYIDFD